MATIPATIDQVTPEWVAEATGLDITAVAHEIIGVGIGVSSAVYRLRLEGNDVPDTLVLKLEALDEQAKMRSGMLHMYEREVKFFDELVTRAPMRVPQGYGGAVSEDGASYYLLMEDLDGFRVVDQNTGIALSDAETAIDSLAQWHATFWGQADQYAATGAALPLDSPIYLGVLPVVFEQGWQKVQAEMDVLPTIADAAPRWVAKLPDMLNALVSGPTTITHGDYRGDNMFFDDNDNLLLLDFQITGIGTGVYDLAYFVTQSLLPDVAAEHEQRLFDRYIAGLTAAGVPEADTADLWDKYRVAALFCLVYPIVASGGMDLSDPRQYALVETMSAGCARAIDALNLRELLD